MPLLTRLLLPLGALALALPSPSQANWIVRQDLARRTFTPAAWDSARQRVVAFAGLIDNGTGDETVEWDGLSWQRRATPRVPPGRNSHDLCFDAARREVLVFGGAGASNDTWVYDGFDWTARLPATRPPGRIDHALAYDSVRQRAVLFGGATGSGVFGDTWEWDGTDWLLRSPPNRPSPRTRMLMAFDPASGTVVLQGGEDFNGRLFDTWTWDGSDWSPAATSGGPGPGESFVLATHWGRGRAQMLVRGSSTADLREWNGSDWITLDSTPLADAPQRPSFLVYDGTRGEMIAGFNSDALTTWAFASGGWERIDERPRPNNAVFTTDAARGRVVMVTAGFYTDATTWEWDGVRWQPRFTSQPIPSGLAFPSLAWHAGIGRSVLFGGTVGSVASDATRLWDGSDWTTLSPAQRPSARFSAGMAYDSLRGVCVLFGGVGASGVLGDTWVFDGVDWTQRQPTRSPPARGASMAYDPQRDRVVLVQERSTATWEWDGADWTQVPGAAPSLSQASMAWDPVRQRVLYTGFGQALWAWDGSVWTRLDATGPFRPAGLAWDPVLERPITMDPQTADTWLFGPGPVASAVRYGVGCAGTAGLVPALTTWGLPVAANADFRLEVVDARPMAPVVAVAGTARAAAPLGGCTVLVQLANSVSVPMAATNAGGFAQAVVPVPADASLAGLLLDFQALVLDPNGAGAGLVALTNGLEVVVGI